jgi:hypothetical protein
MKSRITIEVDFDNGNEPVIQILSRNSDDVRDNLIRSFYQKLGSSSWCRIVFRQDEINPVYPELDFKRIFITPIPQEDLKKEAEIMLEQFNMDEKWKESHLKLMEK